MNDSPKPDDRVPRGGVRITTPARLHLGLLDTAAPFGGVGVMVQGPATEVLVTPHPDFHADAAIAERASAIADRVMIRLGQTARPSCHVQLIRGAMPHCGLGSGTQASLAIAEAMAACLDLDTDAETLAVGLADRGKRSAVGVHGYFRGGLIFENADAPMALNPVHARIELPTGWRILLARPRKSRAMISGDVEREQFAALGRAGSQAKSALLRILADDLLPAAQAHDFDRFTQAVARYNHQSGLLFAPVQGGAYHGADVSRLVQRLAEVGGKGVGQSSWGPGVFAWFANENQARSVLSQVADIAEVIAVTGLSNQGRSLERG